MHLSCAARVGHRHRSAVDRVHRAVGGRPAVVARAAVSAREPLWVGRVAVFAVGAALSGRGMLLCPTCRRRRVLRDLVICLAQCSARGLGGFWRWRCCHMPAISARCACLRCQCLPAIPSLTLRLFCPSLLSVRGRTVSPRLRLSCVRVCAVCTRFHCLRADRPALCVGANGVVAAPMPSTVRCAH